MTDKPKSQKAEGRNNPSAGGHARPTAPTDNFQIKIAERGMRRYHNALKKLAE
jgi:hypothetical protein